MPPYGHETHSSEQPRSVTAQLPATRVQCGGAEHTLQCLAAEGGSFHTHQNKPVHAQLLPHSTTFAVKSVEMLGLLLAKLPCPSTKTR